ncbi:MAG: AAA family ATPase [Phycisphaerae bacterium]
MIKRIKVKGYKSLVDLEVQLQPLSVLFGPNAAGKSNFLDLLQLLSRLATSRTLKEAFAPPYRGLPLESFTFGPEGLAGLVKQESISFNIEVDVRLSPTTVESVNRQIRDMKKTKTADDQPAGVGPPVVRETDLRYRIEIEILPKSGILRVADEYLAPLTAKGEVNNKRRPFLEVVGKRLHLRMEGQAHPTYFERYLDHSMLSSPLYPPHYPHLVAMRQELESCFFFYFEPRERMRAVNPVKEVRHIGLMGEELAPFLNTLRVLDEKQFKNVEKSLHLIIPSVNGIDVSVSALGEVELRLLEGNMPVPARVLSEGTLRVLGLLALGGAKDPPSVVGFEEPENGIHPRRIRLIAELLCNRAAAGKTQLIVTTHSPILTDLIPKESLFVCRKISGRTTIEALSTVGPLFRAGDVGAALDAEEEASPVSERILRGDFDA